MILLLLILTIIFIYIIKKKEYNIKQKNNKINIKKYNDEIKEKIDYKKYYKPKRYVITKNELNFYIILLEIAKELNLIVFSQVSLYNIIITRDELDYSTKTKYFNKIASKSIDFVLADINNCRIKLCIELDDNTHYQKKRIERDNFINNLFENLEIDLIRFKVSDYYNKEALKKRIQESIKEHYYTD